METSTFIIVLSLALFLFGILFFAYRRRPPQPPEPTPGVTIRDATSTHGGLTAVDQTGRGSHVEAVDVKDDVHVSSVLPSDQPADPPAVAAPQVTAAGLNAGGSITLVAGHLVQNYAHSGRRDLDAAALAEGIHRYLTWVENRYGPLNLRGLQPREQGPPLTLSDVYVSLAARLAPDPKEQRRQRDQAGDKATAETVQTLDMRQLLALSPRLVITGGPGSGKTTFLTVIATALTQALRTGDTHRVARYLGLTGPLPLPIFVSLSEYNRYRREQAQAANARQGTLTAFISYTLIRQNALIGLPDDFFEQLLTAGRDCLLLLDGLDEVANERERLLVRQDVEGLAANQSIRQVLVTSRSRAYQGEAILPPPFRLAEVQPMDEDQVAALVARWCQAVYGQMTAAAEQANLGRSIHNLEQLRARRGEPRLVDTPLLVTIVAIVHYDQKRLPEQRAELYARCVEVLLAERYRQASEATFALVDWGGSPTEKRGWLAYLAYQMMGAGEVAGREIKEGQLRAWLRPLVARRRGEAEADEQLDLFIRAMRERGSLLDERDGQYRFTHLTFQEFLNAFYLAETVREVEKITAFLVEEERIAAAWWRETALLLVGYLGLSSEETALTLIQRWAAVEGSAELSLAAVEVAASAFLELDSQDATSRALLTERLVTFLTKRDAAISPPVRARAGDALGRLGDPRSGVGVQQVGAPHLALCYVPPGPFWMGSEEGRDNEKPLHQVDLPGYWISRYPVTVAQFRAFLQHSGYAMRGRQEFLERDPITRPVRYVTWDDALAFCRWLTAQARAAGWLPAAHSLILPSEAEWEKAARGGLLLPQRPLFAQLGEHLATLAQTPPPMIPNPQPQRRYVMGQTLPDGSANIKTAALETTSAVGIFPADCSPYGVMDLAGNVNEWTRSRWGKDWGKPAFVYPYDPADGREDISSKDYPILRGGAWDDSAENWPRCAFRYGTSRSSTSLVFGWWCPHFSPLISDPLVSVPLIWRDSAL